MNINTLPIGMKNIIEKMQLIQLDEFNNDFSILNESIKLFLSKYELTGIRSVLINSEVKSSLIFDRLGLDLIDL